MHAKIFFKFRLFVNLCHSRSDLSIGNESSESEIHEPYGQSRPFSVNQDAESREVM